MIKRSLTEYYIFVFLCIAFCSCTSLRIIDIETAELPEYPIAGDVQGIVLVNTSMGGQFTNIKPDALEKMLANNQMVLDTVFRDSTASDTAIQVAAQAMFGSGRFDVVVPKDRNIAHNNSDSKLSYDLINQLCADFKVDAVLALENFEEHIRTKYAASSSDWINVYTAATDVAYKSEWRLYRKGTDKGVKFQVGDSIFWDGTDYTFGGLYSYMPTTKDALINGGVAMGIKMAGYISPRWDKQNRCYYITGDKDIDAAIPFIDKGDWPGAAAIWTKYATNRSRAVRGKVEYNLALAAEMENDFDHAIEWCLKSFKTKYSNAAEFYLETLIQRKKDFEADKDKKGY